MSSGAIARRLGGVSDRVVRYRVNRLLDRKVVLLQAMVNPRCVGFPVVADVLIEVAPWKLAAACAKLLGIETVASASASHAGRQLSIQVNARQQPGGLAERPASSSTSPQIDGFVSARAAVVPQLVKDLAYWAPRGSGCPGGPAGGRRPEPDAQKASVSVPSRTIWTGGSSGSPRRTPACRRGTWPVAWATSRTGSCGTGSNACWMADLLIIQARIDPHEVGYPVVADSLIEVLPWKFAGVCAVIAAMERVCYISAARLERGGRQLSIETNCRNEGS